LPFYSYSNRHELPMESGWRKEAGMVDTQLTMLVVCKLT
jgi:hypothetical protein